MQGLGKCYGRNKRAAHGFPICLRKQPTAGLIYILTSAGQQVGSMIYLF